MKLKNFSLLDVSDEQIDISIDFDLNKTFKNGDAIPLKITNHTNRKLYFKILNISTTHELSFANPDDWNVLKANENDFWGEYDKCKL